MIGWCRYLYSAVQADDDLNTECTVLFSLAQAKFANQIISTYNIYGQIDAILRVIRSSGQIGDMFRAIKSSGEECQTHR